MSKVTAKIRHELAEMLPPALFFFVALHIVALIRALMNRNTGIELETSAAVTLAALVLGKSVLLADMLPFINQYPNKPLVWNVQRGERPDVVPGTVRGERAVRERELRRDPGHLHAARPVSRGRDL